MSAHLLEWSIRATLMAAGTAAVLRLLRIRSAAAQHAAWTAVLAGMLLMPAWTAWGPKPPLPILPAQGRVALDPTWQVICLVGVVAYFVLRTIKQQTRLLEVEGR